MTFPTAAADLAMQDGKAYPRTLDVAEMRARCQPQTLAFYDYWNARRGGAFAPRRADIDQVEMKEWLPGLQLIDVDAAARRLTCRLVGEANVAARGYNPTGMTVEQGAIGTSVDDVLYEYWLVVEQRTMLYNWAEVPCGGGFLIAQEVLYLPLSDDRQSVNRVVTYSVVEKI